MGSPFNVPQAAFDASAKNLQPEQSRTIELGWRGYGRGYEASVAVYDVKFDNRLLAIAQWHPRLPGTRSPTSVR